MIVLRTVGVAHPVTLIFMTSENMNKSAIGILLRETRVIVTPMACRRTGELVYLKDAYGPKLAPVALSREVGTAGPMVCSTSGLPDGHGNGLIAPRDVPAVFGTNVCTTVGVDRDMAGSCLALGWAIRCSLADLFFKTNKKSTPPQILFFK